MYTYMYVIRKKKCFAKSNGLCYCCCSFLNFGESYWAQNIKKFAVRTKNAISQHPQH